MSPSVTKRELSECIRDRRFSALFIRLGWDKDNLPSGPLILGDNGIFPIDRVVEKRGFVVCVCDAGPHYPSAKSDRRRLVNQLSRHHYEHLLILCGEGRQCWTVAIRPQNRPLRTVEVEWNESQDIQPLMEKLDGMIFDISEEETIRITDVVDRVHSAFMKDAETVTRRFYKEFKDELSAFTGFIQGIRDQVSKKWYAALMLNRLMFVYFIQKKRFLDGNPDYLETRLLETQEEFGEDEFDKRFYRHFLRRLFSEGLGTPESARDLELKQLLGRVPYLNGGLFDLHEIERQNEDIEIPDKAFEKLFAFFGKYNWRLDTRANATAKDINPDVIGYIFEKYINDRAAMGAYYTQEDITGYITRNTIIPFLLNRAKEKCKNAFDPQNGIWRFLRENPDNYIYEAVKKGGDIPDDEIPDNIRRGMDTEALNLITRRKDWNTKTEDRFALPTEIWRETMARRKRYFELKAKIKNGEIHEIDDLITYNLDIERFASDALRHYEGSDFIAAFYEAIAGRKALKSNDKEIRGITVLDPACGSGAFLFAALNILEPLYERCIERIEDFVDEDDKLREQGERKGTKKHPQFRVVLEDIEKHQNQKYWIYKTIILNNLYGVDLMKEATEIAKLRLFLKLAAEAEYDKSKANLGLEPLPDIDFNIRSGNSLVGFASMEQFEKAVVAESSLGMDLSGGLVDEVREQAKLVQKANEAFRRAQDSGDDSYREAKDELSKRLAGLNETMNRCLADRYEKNNGGYKNWLKSHQPFHWVSEFYGILEEGKGFDVVVGNPPYLETAQVDYDFLGLETVNTKAVHAMFIENSEKLLGENGALSMIVPLSLVSTQRMKMVQKILERDNSVWYSNYAWRPGKLFDTVNRALTIFVTISSGDGCFSTNYQKWNSLTRSFLFDNISFFITEKQEAFHFSIPKMGSPIEKSLISKVLSSDKTFGDFLSKHGPKIFYRTTGGLYWKIFTDFSPEFLVNGELGSSSRETTMSISEKRYVYPAIATLSSSLFWWWYSLTSNLRDLNPSDIHHFPVTLSVFEDSDLLELGKKYVQDLKGNSFMQTRFQKQTGETKTQSFKVQKSKPIVDKIDHILAKHYGFTEDELDYIINYDIKYRMGLAK